MKVHYHKVNHAYPHRLTCEIGLGSGFANKLSMVVNQITQQCGPGHPGIGIHERYFPNTRWCFWGTQFHFRTRDDAMLAKLTLNV